MNLPPVLQIIPVGRRSMARITLVLIGSIAMLSTPARAILPPADVDCCHRKDYQSDRCVKFSLDAATCEKKIADFAEFYRKFSAVQQSAAQAHAVAVTRIEARLYYSQSGTFSPVIDGTMVLRNVASGGSGTAGPSNAMRVDVIVKGPAGVSVSGRQVALTATHARSGKFTSRQTADIGQFSATGEYRAAFMLQGTGCEPLLLSAQAGESGETESLEIPFQCAE
jgi:hypothetical protein